MAIIGRPYVANVNQIAVSTVQDLMELSAPSDAVCRVYHIWITQTLSEVSYQLPVLIHRGTASGSGGSTVVPEPLAEGDAAFGGGFERNNTTQSTEGEILHSEGFNMLNGFLWPPIPEMFITVSPSQFLIVELPVAISPALTISAGMYFTEIGG